ncbi:PriCT-2 domain-containing protein [Coleofasciculus sp. E1-EBD-02]
MSLKYISPNLLPAWDEWSQLSPKYKPGECAYKWGTFNGQGITDKTLHYYARNS